MPSRPVRAIGTHAGKVEFSSTSRPIYVRSKRDEASLTFRRRLRGPVTDH